MLNALIGSLFIYKAQVLSGIPKNLETKLNRILENFIWNGRKPKIRLDMLQSNQKQGGLGWCHGNTFASHRYGPGSTLSPNHMWDVFHPSQPTPGGFLLGVSSTLRRARNCSVWNRLIRSTGLARTCSGWRKISSFYMVKRDKALKIAWVKHINDMSLV